MEDVVGSKGREGRNRKNDCGGDWSGRVSEKYIHTFLGIPDPFAGERLFSSFSQTFLFLTSRVRNIKIKA